MWRDDNDKNYSQSYKFTISPDYFRKAARPPVSGMRFSNLEIKHLLVSIIVLTIAFGMALSDGIFGMFYDLAFLSLNIIVSFFAVFTAFVFHELAHKKVAQAYGCFAEYRMSQQGLFLAIFTGALGFLFALPGAVIISGFINAEQNAKISLSGPAVNMIIGAICLSLLIPFGDTFSYPIWIIAFVNCFLAVLNLLPIRPLDGSKIFPWNLPLYIGIMAIAVALLVTTFITPSVL